MAHHVIYVPGLGDQRSYGQDMAINLWRLFGLKPHYFPLGWIVKSGIDEKLNRLEDKIASLKTSGNFVSLVGVSAGASAVINAYCQSKSITGVVYIVGKINRPGSVSSRTYRANPDFKESMNLLQTNLQKLSGADKSRLLSIRPHSDQTVDIADTKIAGVKEVVLPGSSHAQGIVSGVILGTPLIARFLHSLESS